MKYIISLLNSFDDFWTLDIPVKEPVPWVDKIKRHFQTHESCGIALFGHQDIVQYLEELPDEIKADIYENLL